MPITLQHLSMPRLHEVPITLSSQRSEAETEHLRRSRGSCEKGLAKLLRQSRERLRRRKQSIQRILRDILLLIIQEI
jgi:hypothetical protein